MLGEPGESGEPGGDWRGSEGPGGTWGPGGDWRGSWRSLAAWVDWRGSWGSGGAWVPGGDWRGSWRSLGSLGTWGSLGAWGSLRTWPRASSKGTKPTWKTHPSSGGHREGGPTRLQHHQCGHSHAHTPHVHTRTSGPAQLEGSSWALSSTWGSPSPLQGPQCPAPPRPALLVLTRLHPLTSEGCHRS